MPEHLYYVSVDSNTEYYLVSFPNEAVIKDSEAERSGVLTEVSANNNRV
jgi:hypothetical protein